ncbi:MAG: hypothetical protein ACTSO9_11705 [Candidatus Helarchaeota archaeon]
MLSRCTFYDKCSSTDRLTFGNNEYNCLGSTSYEYCQKYKQMILIYSRETILDPIEELNKVIREIYQRLNQILNEKIYLAILMKDGKFVYCDYSELVNEIDYILGFTKDNFDKISIGNILINKPDNDFGFYKISSDTLLIINLKSKKIELFEKIKLFFLEYGSKIKRVIDRIEQSKKAILEKETSRLSISSVIFNLKTKLEEEITALNFANELKNALSIISKRFAWNPLIYEINTFINKLKTYQKDQNIKSDDKKELIKKLNEWGKKVSKS